ncbi:hypothetical protein A2U01_0096653 [Trifolium medium]|uniref:Uncharacterized protein n=1 Tax=Trifolium medium TaxID=97028 RepID=A0A392US08_9FABA|nr:hypothetical protein [Trifolium medium]
MVRQRVELAPCIESLPTKVFRLRVPLSSVANGGTSVWMKFLHWLKMQMTR